MTGLEALHQLIDNHYKTYEVLKRKYGIIKKVLSYEKAIVTIEHGDMLALQKEYRNRSPEEEANVKAEKGDVTLLNMTGEELKNGDSVWIHYWTTVTSGYIAIKNGGSKYNTSGDSLTVQKLAVLTVEQGNLYAHAKKYDSSSEWGSDYENTKWRENYDSRVMNVDERNNLKIAQGEESHGYNTIFVNGNPVLIMRSSSVILDDLPLVNSNFFVQEMNVRISRSVQRRTFNGSRPVSTTYNLDPTKDSKLFIAPRSIISNNGAPRYYYSVMVEQDGIENIILNNEQYFSNATSAFDNIYFFLIMWNKNNIYIPDSTFPNGSIDVGCLIYNIWDGYGIYNYNMTMGFQNNAEYEYAKCVLSSCDYIITGE